MANNKQPDNQTWFQIILAEAKKHTSKAVVLIISSVVVGFFVFLYSMTMSHISDGLDGYVSSYIEDSKSKTQKALSKYLSGEIKDRNSLVHSGLADFFHRNTENRDSKVFATLKSGALSALSGSVGSSAQASFVLSTDGRNEEYMPIYVPKEKQVRLFVEIITSDLIRPIRLRINNGKPITLPTPGGEFSDITKEIEVARAKKKEYLEGAESVGSYTMEEEFSNIFNLSFVIESQQPDRSARVHAQVFVLDPLWVYGTTN